MVRGVCRRLGPRRLLLGLLLTLRGPEASTSPGFTVGCGALAAHTAHYSGKEASQGHSASIFLGESRTNAHQQKVAYVTCLVSV